MAEVDKPRRRPVSMATHSAAARVLGLNPLPTAAEIKSAYRRHAKLYHPDMAPLGGAKAEREVEFLRIREAFETLQRPTMSDTAIKLTTPASHAAKDEIRRYRANTGSGPIVATTVLLFALTGLTAFDLYRRKRMPWQQ